MEQTPKAERKRVWTPPDRWSSAGKPYPELEAIDVRLFRYIVTVAREKKSDVVLSDENGFLQWFVDGLRIRFSQELREGYDVPAVLHEQLVALLAAGHPVQGPWGYLTLEEGKVTIHAQVASQ